MASTFLRDLLLRPTELPPGSYPVKDAQGGKVTIQVIKHNSGRNYLMLWCDVGEAEKIARPGDTIFERAFVQEDEPALPPTQTPKLLPSPPKPKTKERSPKRPTSKRPKRG
jgi:hypothetical protein